MLIIKAFHIIAMVCWFAGLFYLPRLFVYHAQTFDTISDERFKIMERRLYYGITWPAAILTSILGLWLVSFNAAYYLRCGWMHKKFLLVLFVWGYHLYCGHCLKQFDHNKNDKTALFFRIFNELPVFFLAGIIILVVVKPS